MVGLQSADHEKVSERISVNSEMRASEKSEVPKPDAFTPVLNGKLVSIK